MPREYKPHGKKKYTKYDPSLIQEAVDEYLRNPDTYSLSCLGTKYGIHKSVLFRHTKKIMKNQGGQTALTPEIEEQFVKYINVCAAWGYPLEPLDMRFLVKAFLDKQNLVVKRFKDNLPGPDFVYSFLKRHKDSISQRISQNIKRNRAEVSTNTIKAYFNELQTSIKDIALDNIINYVETNLTDDPGRRKILTKRGTKYPERVMNYSKSSTSIMMACTASGILLPPYVVYKAQNLYDSWKANGPKGARYNRSQSGWFDANIFEDWVKTIVIPFFEDKPGRKCLIGDNLSSHLSIDLIKECKNHNIDFIFLPANSTHLTQPLDVAFFRPMKTAWRHILEQWKRTDGMFTSSVPKGCFPKLLATLYDSLEEKVTENILAGFKKCGISPFDPLQVLKRLPDYIDPSEENIEYVDEAVLDLLKEMRYGTMNIIEPKKKKKINVLPGKSVTEGTENEYNIAEKEDSDDEMTNNIHNAAQTEEINIKEGVKQNKAPKIKTDIQNAKNEGPRIKTIISDEQPGPSGLSRGEMPVSNRKYKIGEETLKNDNKKIKQEYKPSIKGEKPRTTGLGRCQMPVSDSTLELPLNNNVVLDEQPGPNGLSRGEMPVSNRKYKIGEETLKNDNKKIKQEYKPSIKGKGIGKKNRSSAS